MRTFRPALAALGLLGVLAIAPQPAPAFPVRRFCYLGTTSYGYDFVDSPGLAWTPAARSAVASGFTVYNQVRNLSGSAMVDVHAWAARPSGVRVIVRLSRSPGGARGAMGYSACDLPAQIQINPDFASRYTSIASHEMGHLLGGEHSGDDDNLDPLTAAYPPAMTTSACSNARPNSRFGADDWGFISSLHSSYLPHYANANAGFEVAGAGQATRYWYVTGGSLVERVGRPGQGTATGTKAVVWDFNRTTDSLWQRVSLSASQGRRIDVTGMFQVDGNAIVPGTVRVELLRRGVTYARDTRCSSGERSYPSPTSQGIYYDFNRATRDASWVRVASATCMLRVGYAPCTTNAFTLPAPLWSSDYQIRVFASSRNLLGYDRLWVDDLRLRILS